MQCKPLLNTFRKLFSKILIEKKYKSEFLQDDEKRRGKKRRKRNRKQWLVISCWQPGLVRPATQCPDFVGACSRFHGRAGAQSSLFVACLV